MTIAKLRTAFNDAVRTHQVESFSMRLMPRVFALLEEIESSQRVLGKEICNAYLACRDIELPPKKKPDPSRYCGGR
jgi:hypothetical protein